MKPAVDMAQRLKSELPRMLDEHEAIVATLQSAKLTIVSASEAETGSCPGLRARILRFWQR